MSRVDACRHDVIAALYPTAAGVLRDDASATVRPHVRHGARRLHPARRLGREDLLQRHHAVVFLRLPAPHDQHHAAELRLHAHHE